MDEEPGTLDELCEKYGMKIVATGPTDDDKVSSFKKNRIVFYINKSNLKSVVGLAFDASHHT